MRANVIRLAGLAALLAASAPAAPGATPKEIDRAIKGGTDALKAKYGRGGAQGQENAIGPVCLCGLALLESGVPTDDDAVKAITAAVRDASYKQVQTYSVALSLMYLDRLGDAGDVPLIQMLAARLIVGQTTDGGWDYACIDAVPAADEAVLRKNLKDAQLVAGGAAGGPPKLHPTVAEYGNGLFKARGAPKTGGDNSNTQFAVMAVWMSRKHGAPVDDALNLIEKRFAVTQNARTGNWPYSQGGGDGSPAMYCAGLLGMATGLARREERRLKADTPPAPKPDAPAKPDKPSDPFYNPPAGTAPPPKKPGNRPADPADGIIWRGFAGLKLAIADQLRAGKGLLNANGGHGHGDLYFLWSLERVCVVYGLEKLDGFDWYDVGSTALVRSQGADGAWAVGGYQAEVNTAFAVLFLCRSNLARDLSNKVQKDSTSAEMRAGSGPSAADLLPNRPVATTPAPVAVISLPNPTNDPTIAQAGNMLKATQSDWAKMLASAREAKGTANTHALVIVATRAEGDRKAAARDALAERLCRMTPATLRSMLKAEEAELRRAAALACAMKDDKDHIPDLIAALTDPDDNVTRAAKAGLKSFTGKDFGPVAAPTADQKAASAKAWQEWYASQKK